MTADKYKKAQPALVEKHEVITNDRGFEMKLKDIFTSEVGIRWGEYQNPEITTIQLQPEQEGIVAHFQLQGHESDLPEKSFVFCREPAQPYEITLSATNGSKRAFFELVVSPAFFNNFSDDSSSFLARFQQQDQYQAAAPEFRAKATPEMFRVIAEMWHTPYAGNLNRLFMESKATELLLLQIARLDSQTAGATRLTASDIERLTFIKEYLDRHFAAELSISLLSRHAAISQTSLKSGFRQLFDTTVFGYITGLRLAEAKRLLTEEKLQVSEVADRVGYRYPHHFAAAFKKKFGISPASLKSL